MKEILPDIYTWHEFSEEKQLNFNGYLYISGKESVLIDPPRMTKKDFSELENLVGENSVHPLKTVLLTNVHHERGCDEFRKKFSCDCYFQKKF